MATRSAIVLGRNRAQSDHDQTNATKVPRSTTICVIVSWNGGVHPAICPRTIGCRRAWV
jgi:hypothetical protein